jgi:hypothetical protein
MRGRQGEHMTKEFDGAGMLNETRRWLDWVQKSLDGALRMVAVAKSKPSGLKQDSNLILDSEGHVWEHDWHRNVYAELARTTTFGPYVATGRTIPDDPRRAFNGGDPMTFSGVTFVAKGWSQSDADWTWIPDRYGMSSLSYYQGTVEYNARGATFAAAVLAVPAEELDVWARRRADTATFDVDRGQHRRGTDHLNGDWPSFLAAFSLPTGELPDSGALRCHVHLMVDRAAGLTETSYAH